MTNNNSDATQTDKEATENDTETNKVKSKPLTLSTGKTLEDLKRQIEQKEQALKGKAVLQVVSKKKAAPKSQEEKKPSQDTNQETTLRSTEEVAKANSNLSKLEQENRLRVLEKARANKEDAGANAIGENTAPSFIGPNIITKSIPEPLVSPPAFKKDARDVDKFTFSKEFESNPLSVDESEEELKGDKKKSLLKKKSKTDIVKNWKGLTFSDEEEIDQLQQEEDEGFEPIPEEEVYSATILKPTVDIKRRGKTRKDKTHKKYEAKEAKHIKFEEGDTVKDIAHKMSEKARIVLGFLRKMGVEANEDTSLDNDTAELLINEMGHNAIIVNPKSGIEAIYQQEDKEEDLAMRPPVVTIMGHVDHGKTSLLDYIRKTNVAAKESGGITQHIGAYQITTSKKDKITFLDTPGHEAFTEMRARGATVTDIVVLVVAADDGLKPQSIEAINHAKSANVPIIVAINKIDKTGANPQKVKTELLAHNPVVEEMGGEILCNEISAKEGTGVNDLLDSILLQSELMNLKANPKRNAQGRIIEAKIEKGKGFVATVIVQNGTLKKGDIFVSGKATGKVRLIINDLNQQINQALPGTPVEITGFNEDVQAGDDFIVVNNEAEANKIKDFRVKEETIKSTENKGSYDDLSYLFQTVGSDKARLSVIIKADVHGSKEAINASLAKISHEEVEIKVVHSGIGPIIESDVMLAKTANTIIYGFNVRANNQARDLASSEKVEIRYFSIIYDLLEDIKTMLAGLLNPLTVENILGYAEIREIFNVSKVGNIAGSHVTEGLIKKSAKVRVLREGVVIHEGVLAQLKRFKDDAKEVKAGYDCGIMLQNFQDIRIGDIIECYEHNYTARTLDNTQL